MADYAYLDRNSSINSARQPSFSSSLVTAHDPRQAENEGGYRVDEVERSLEAIVTSHLHQRQDSMFEESPPFDECAFSSQQEHYTQPQPGYATPQSQPQRPVNMSRTKSQISNRSADYMQGRGIRAHRASLSFGSKQSPVQMSRSFTQPSVESLCQWQSQNQTVMGSPISRAGINQTSPGEVPMGTSWRSRIQEYPHTSSTTAISEVPLHASSNTDSLDYWSHTDTFERVSSPSGVVEVNESAHSSYVPPRIRFPTRNHTFDQLTTSESYQIAADHNDIQDTIQLYTASPYPANLDQNDFQPSDHESPPPPPLKRRRRRSTNSISKHNHDPVVAHVTLDQKYKCCNEDCFDLEFGRYADFRRHYLDKHETQKEVFFCPIAGCARSKDPPKGVKLKNFGNRKDKMEEHVRNMHSVTSKRKRRVSNRDYSVNESGDEDVSDSKRTRRADAHIDRNLDAWNT